MRVVDRSLKQPMEVEERASQSLAGGIAQNGYQCGMLWGAAFAAGAKAYQLYGTGAKAEAAAIMASQKVVKSFRGQMKNEINCMEITDLNWQAKNNLLPILKFLVRGGPVNCLLMVSKYAHKSLDSINDSLAKKPIKAPPEPASCASLLVRKMGASDKHIVMAAGLAGGIGLSGGGCGALGATIWLSDMNSTNKKRTYKDANLLAGDIIKKFLKGSDFKFECSEIVGRKFENVNDHAAYIRGGGCADIIEALTSK